MEPESGPDLDESERQKERDQMAKFEVYQRVPQDSAAGKRVKSEWAEDYKVVGGSSALSSAEKLSYGSAEKRPSAKTALAIKFARNMRYDKTSVGTPLLKAVWSGSRSAAVLVGPSGRKKTTTRVRLHDVSGTFYQAVIVQDIYATSPKGDEKERWARQLQRARHGTRRASFPFRNYVTETSESIGFILLRVACSVFGHKGKDIYPVVYGGDFVVMAESGDTA